MRLSAFVDSIPDVRKRIQAREMLRRYFPLAFPRTEAGP